jgi:glutathione synthase
MRSRDNFSSDSINFAPFVLLPSTFPRCEFEKSVRIQPVLNELMHNVAHDYEFLSSCLEKYVQQYVNDMNMSQTLILCFFFL